MERYDPPRDSQHEVSPSAPSPWWASRYPRMGLLLLCLLAMLIALLEVRGGWFDLTGSNAQQVSPLFAAGCPSRDAPEVRSVTAEDLQTLREQLTRIMPARVGRTYETGAIATSSLWSDAFPRPTPPSGGPVPAAYEVRWWALDRFGAEEDTVADVFEFATAKEAERALALGASPRCRRDGVTSRATFPAGAREISWINPDNAHEWDIVFVRGRRLYRTVDVPPEHVPASTVPQHSRLALPLTAGSAQAMACALPQAGCPSSLSFADDTSIAPLSISRTSSVRRPTRAQMAAYVRAVNLHGYDVPWMTEIESEHSVSVHNHRYREVVAGCTGKPHAATVAYAIHSPTFRYLTRDDYEAVYSTVSVFSSSASAGQDMKVLESMRDQSCIRRALSKDGTRALNRLSQIRPKRLPTTMPSHYWGSGPYRAIALRYVSQVESETQTGRRKLPFYTQIFDFVYGRTVVELTTFTLASPYRTANEQYLESALVGRAEANEALL